MINGVNHSLASLRGYMNLGDPPQNAKTMKVTRQAAWNFIENEIKEYDVLSKRWTVPANVNRLKEIKSELEAFETAQQEIEDVSYTGDKISSYRLLLTDVAPRAGQMLVHISAIIDEESALEATEARKLLLKNLADTRGSFAVSLANIRAYLLSGDNVFKTNFEAKWQVNEQRISTINESHASLFNPTQQKSWLALLVFAKNSKIYLHKCLVYVVMMIGIKLIID